MLMAIILDMRTIPAVLLNQAIRPCRMGSMNEGRDVLYPCRDAQNGSVQSRSKAIWRKAKPIVVLINGGFCILRSEIVAGRAAKINRRAICLLASKSFGKAPWQVGHSAAGDGAECALTRARKFTPSGAVDSGPRHLADIVCSNRRARIQLEVRG